MILLLYAAVIVTEISIYCGILLHKLVMLFKLFHTFYFRPFYASGATARTYNTDVHIRQSERLNGLSLICSLSVLVHITWFERVLCWRRHKYPKPLIRVDWNCRTGHWRTSKKTGLDIAGLHGQWRTSSQGWTLQDSTLQDWTLQDWTLTDGYGQLIIIS